MGYFHVFFFFCSRVSFFTTIFISLHIYYLLCAIVCFFFFIYYFIPTISSILKLKVSRCFMSFNLSSFYTILFFIYFYMHMQFVSLVHSFLFTSSFFFNVFFIMFFFCYLQNESVFLVASQSNNQTASHPKL